MLALAASGLSLLVACVARCGVRVGVSMCEEMQADAVPWWESVLKQCWSPECPYLAIVQDSAGWWWCFEHQDRSMTGSPLHIVTWVGATEAIRRAALRCRAEMGEHDG